MSGRLIGIARKAKPFAPVEELIQATVSLAAGIGGDARGKLPNAQVTVVFRQDWEAACRELEAALPWTMRRANLYVEGVPCPMQPGARLGIGEVVLEVVEETHPCSRMDKQHPGLKAALTPHWRGGVRCNVVQAGDLRLGDAVVVTMADEAVEAA